MENTGIVLDRDDLRRALVRIAHEIVEGNADGDPLALVGHPHPRRSHGPPAARPDRGARRRRRSRSGEVDITFYRDDVGSRPISDAPVVHSSRIDFPLEGTTVVLVDDVLYTGRTVRAAIDSLFDYGRPGPGPARRAGRPRPPRAADPPRLRGQEPADLARQRVNVRLEETDGVDEVEIVDSPTNGGRMKHLLSIADLSRADIERVMTVAESFAEVVERDIKKVPTLRGRTVVNLFYESSTRTSSSFELAAKRLSADVVGVRSTGSARRQGRVAARHDRDAVRLRPGGDRDPRALGRSGRPRRAPDLGVGRERRRRQARAPEPGAARRVHAAPPAGLARRRLHLDRRRRAAQPRRALQHPRLHPHGRAGHGLRPADPDPARRREPRLRGALRPRRRGRGRRRLRAADAERAHGRRGSSCRRCASTSPATRSTAAGCTRASS